MKRPKVYKKAYAAAVIFFVFVVPIIAGMTFQANVSKLAFISIPSIFLWSCISPQSAAPDWGLLPFALFQWLALVAMLFSYAFKPNRITAGIAALGALIWIGSGLLFFNLVEDFSKMSYSIF